MGCDVTRNNGRLLEVDPVARLNIAFQLALDDHGARIDVGFDATVRPDRQAVSSRVDDALDQTIYIKLFASGQFPFDHN